MASTAFSSSGACADKMSNTPGPILVPRAAILLASATDRELWQEPILQSAIRGLPVNCAAARFRERGAKMAGERSIDIFHEALNFGLQLLGAGHLQLKEKQCEVLKVCSY